MRSYLFIVLIYILGFTSLQQPFCVGKCETLSEGHTRGFSLQKDKDGVIKQCVYIDDNERSVDVSVNDVFKHYDDCTACICKATGLMVCCSFGYKRASETQYPEGCHLKRLDNCQSVLTNSPDGNVSCPLLKSSDLLLPIQNLTQTSSRRSENETDIIPETDNDYENNDCVIYRKSLSNVILSSLFSLVVLNTLNKKH